MSNVFDLVTDFYNQDEDWNTVLRQKYAESFLRSCAWQGASDDELLRYWDHITMLCLYLGNAENYLGDMSADDFIDCVAWCGRNVSEFSLQDNEVLSFFATMTKLYEFLAAKNIITNAEPPVLAQEKLFRDGKIIMMDKTGHFYSKYDEYNRNATEDLPAKIFLNIGERLQNLLEALRTFFADRKYHRDIERAAFLYSGIFLSGGAEEKPGTEEYAQCFWDYFLFDYIMIETDKNPLQYFYDEICAGQFSEDGQVNKDVLEELLKAQLVLFSIKETSDDGIYSCTDFLTGENYSLLLPVEDNIDKEAFLFLGHIFYNRSMVMNFVRGMTIPKSSRKKLFQVMEKARQWMAVRYGGKLSWTEFIRRNPMFIRHCSLIYSAYVKLDGFNYTHNIIDYHPQPIAADDRVAQLIAEMMKPYAFTAYDIFLAQTMWSDFIAGSQQKVKLPDLWAAGIISNFIAVNGVYNYNATAVSEMCHNIPESAIAQAAAQIKEKLQIILHDPRYINEEGLLLMLLS